MSSYKVRAVFFDYDGTLTDTWRLYIEAFRRTLNEITGTKYTGDDVVALHPKPEIRFFLEEPYRDRYDVLYGAFIRHYTECHDEFFDGAYPGAVEAVRALMQREVPLAMITGKSRAAYDATQAHQAGLPESRRVPDFEVSVVDDDVNLPKPSPEGLLQACHRLGLKGEEILYVGDSAVDLRAAIAIGGAFAGAGWAKNAEERREFEEICERHAGEHLERVKILEEPSEILTLLDELGAG